jgi:hypothetical protein
MQLRKNIVALVTFVFLAIILGSQSGVAQQIRSRSKLLESLTTKAGVLKLIRIDEYDISETNWLVLLNGKRLYRTQDDVFGSVRFHTIFKGFASRDVVVMQETFNPEGLSEFRIIDLPAKGQATIGERFGIFAPPFEPLITQNGQQITFSFVGKPGIKPDAWVYQNGVLTKQ